jgi:hypothetical protein
MQMIDWSLLSVVQQHQHRDVCQTKIFVVALTVSHFNAKQSLLGERHGKTRTSNGLPFATRPPNNFWGSAIDSGLGSERSPCIIVCSQALCNVLEAGRHQASCGATDVWIWTRIWADQQVSVVSFVTIIIAHAVLFPNHIRICWSAHSHDNNNTESIELHKLDPRQRRPHLERIPSTDDSTIRYSRAIFEPPR